jgi:hypothetical protein
LCVGIGIPPVAQVSGLSGPTTNRCRWGRGTDWGRRQSRRFFGSTGGFAVSISVAKCNFVPSITANGAGGGIVSHIAGLSPSGCQRNTNSAPTSSPSGLFFAQPPGCLKRKKLGRVKRCARAPICNGPYSLLIGRAEVTQNSVSVWLSAWQRSRFKNSAVTSILVNPSALRKNTAQVGREAEGTDNRSEVNQGPVIRCDGRKDRASGAVEAPARHGGSVGAYPGHSSRHACTEAARPRQGIGGRTRRSGCHEERGAEGVGVGKADFEAPAKLKAKFERKLSALEAG